MATVSSARRTAGGYSTKLSRKVQSLYENGCSIQQIMDETGLKKSSVHGYLPYVKGNYNLPESSLNAERRRTYRKRIRVCEQLMLKMDSTDVEEYLWDAIVAFADYLFETEKGLSMKYTVKGGEIFFNRKEKSVAWQAEMTREQLGRIERDQCFPSVETIGRLEKALNLEPMTLLKLKIIPELCDFQMTEEEKSVNIVCRELEIALISNLTKPDMLKACDVISNGKGWRFVV